MRAATITLLLLLIGPTIAVASAARADDGAFDGSATLATIDGPTVLRIELPADADPIVFGRKLAYDDFDFWHADRRDRSVIVALRDRADADRLDVRLTTWTRARSEDAATLRVAIDDHHTAGLTRIRDRTAARFDEGTGGIPSFPCYRTVDETYADLDALAAAHPNLAQWIDIGDSWEKQQFGTIGDDIRALVLGRTDLPVDDDGPLLVIIAAMHARELTTAESATRFAEALVNGYGVDADATWLLDHGRIHIVPQLNPDGRREAEGGASWRKNTNTNFCGGFNPGVDLNRNSSFFWGGSGSSGSTCAENFRGDIAASEPETQAIEAYLAQVLPDQRGSGLADPAPSDARGIFISIHSFSELILFPWEATTDDAPNAAQLARLGRKFGFYTGYDVCQDCLGTAAGTTVDEAYGRYGVAGYTFELGTTFFQDCADYEADIAPVVADALRYAAKASRRPYQTPAGPESLDLQLTPATVSAPGIAVALTATADDNRFFSGGFGTEPVEGVGGAWFSVGVPPWDPAAVLTPMQAVDGAFGDASEALEATVSTSGLAPGRYPVFVVAEDALGQRGVTSAIFLQVGGDADTIFIDGFESADVSGWSGVTPPVR